MRTMTQHMPPHRITLPEAFGTNTLHGLVYELANPPGCQKNDFSHMKAFLEIPMVISIGFRTPKELLFIAEEARDFVVWCEKNVGFAPQITFV